MAASGSTANGVLVFMPPNSAGIIHQGQGVSGAISQNPEMVQCGPQQFRVMNPGNQPLGSVYPGSPAEQVMQLRQMGMTERFLKAQSKTLGLYGKVAKKPVPSSDLESLGPRAIQILIGLMHIGFGGLSGAFIGHYTPISFMGGYPFWGGLSVAAKGIAVLLLLFTILEFSIAVSTSYFACLAICYTPNTAMLFRPYVANANFGVPSAQMASPAPPTNVA
ncbi:Membrane-spanning 4-domains subfamily A member 8 [Platysternon megacephalum]|uniref:Membrane-spanning 4-domains subfamily A member 8 n=1 Tax=Platysternon megacephalum TaxID=55544 RepID=A0A4D9DT73_9SAUR|nr:Membrane-spanning 4-domains subfamily A member 8 [Platysternon megacephalum]